MAADASRAGIRGIAYRPRWSHPRRGERPHRRDDGRSPQAPKVAGGPAGQARKCSPYAWRTTSAVRSDPRNSRSSTSGWSRARTGRPKASSSGASGRCGPSTASSKPCSPSPRRALPPSAPNAQTSTRWSTPSSSRTSKSAAELGIDLKVESPGGLQVACSEGVLASVLGNLVSNALKHMGDSQERHVIVRSRPKGRRVCIEVRDTGPGLPEGASERIFESLRPLGHAEPGVGAGARHGQATHRGSWGAIGVQRATPSGSIFWFELPAASTEARAR